MTHQESAVHAWGLMWNWAMPAGVAIDYVMEAGCDRPEAVECLITVAVAKLRISTPGSARTPPIFQVEAGMVAGHVLAGDLDAAADVHRVLRNRAIAHRQHVELSEFVAPSESIALAGRWVDWCWDSARVIGLCRDVLAARSATPA